ncbi:MAG TPA: PTS sugar transporter subunit IIB [Candidatus Limnocylindrales bacterium]
MPLKLVRVDDRLIHGQVVAVWLRAVGADRILVVDDAVAADPFLSDVLRLAAPPDVPVEVHGLAGGAARARELAASPEAAFVLLRSPVSALRLREAGVRFDVLNLGGLGAGPGRHPLHRSIHASDEELAALRRLEALGTRVELRLVADERPVPLRSVDRAGGPAPDVPDATR